MLDDAGGHEPIGRAVATVLMIAGFATLSLLTGIIASLLVHKQAQQEATDLEELDSRRAAPARAGGIDSPQATRKVAPC